MPPAHLHPAAPQLRIVVADADDADDAARAARVAELRADGFVVAAQAAIGRQAVELTIYYEPELLLLCPGFVTRGVLDVTREVLDARADVGVVLLIPADDRDLAQAAIAAGARAVLPGGAPAPILHSALRTVATGLCALTPELVHGVTVAPGAGYRPIHGPLSNREWEILDGLFAGHTADELRSRLVITDEMMRSHLKHIRHKLGVRSHDELMAAAKELFFSRAPFLSRRPVRPPDS